MDINDARIVVMMLGLVLFLAIWAWAWSSRRKKAFDEAANLPFLDDEREARAATSQGRAKTTTPPRGAGATGAVAATHGEKQ